MGPHPITQYLTQEQSYPFHATSSFNWVCSQSSPIFRNDCGSRGNPVNTTHSYKRTSKGKGGSSSPQTKDHSPWRAQTPQNKAEAWIRETHQGRSSNTWGQMAFCSEQHVPIYPCALRSQIQFPGGKRLLVFSQKVSSHGQSDRIWSHNSINQKCNLLPRARKQRTVKSLETQQPHFLWVGHPAHRIHIRWSSLAEVRAPILIPGS